jgi:hypothetical protein
LGHSTGRTEQNLEVPPAVEQSSALTAMNNYYSTTTTTTTTNAKLNISRNSGFSFKIPNEKHSFTKNLAPHVNKIMKTTRFLLAVRPCDFKLRIQPHM